MLYLYPLAMTIDYHQEIVTALLAKIDMNTLKGSCGPFPRYQRDTGWRAPDILRVRQIFFTKLVPGQVACKSHLPRRMRWLSHVTDGTSAAEIILHHLVVINKDI